MASLWDAFVNGYLVLKADVEDIFLLDASLQPEGPHATHAAVVLVELLLPRSLVQASEPAATRPKSAILAVELPK